LGCDNPGTTSHDTRMLMEHGVRCKQFAEGFNQLLLQQAEKVVVAFLARLGGSSVVRSDYSSDDAVVLSGSEGRPSARAVTIASKIQSIVS